ATNGQAVAPVRRDRDVEYVVAQREQLDRVVTRHGLTRLQDDDAVRAVVAETELRAGADHPAGDMAVRLPRGDREPARQHRTRQDDDHEVADREVVRATDDPLRLVLADVERAPADRLAVLLRLVLV